MTVASPPIAAHPTRLSLVWREVRSSPSAPVYLVLLGLLVTSWFLVALRGGEFLTVDNLTSILVRAVALGLVAAGQTLVILAGSIDLSVVWLISVVSVLTSVLMQGDPGLVLPAVLAVAAVGALIGLVNGLVVTKLHVNAFIATLGMALILRGLLQSQVSNFAGSVPREFQALAYDAIGPVPYSLVLFGGVVAAVWFIQRFTRFGHHLYAVGASEETARLSGVRSHRVIIAAHILCSLTAVLTGLFLVSRLRAGAPFIGPEGAYDLESIAAVIVGGTALAGGRGGVLGTLAGVLILALLDNAFNQLGVSAFWKNVIRGVIIIAAVALYAYLFRKRAR